ncbi:MAG: SLC13 family permease [Candidatus Thorarchaeota archaeon]|jgi:Na+/H+ antiporter NhaD/arsenite permease-like protein
MCIAAADQTSSEIIDMDALGVVVLIVFIATYAIISTEKVNRTGMALLGMGVIGFVFLVAWWMGIQPIQADADAWDHDPFLVLVNTIEWDTVLFVTAMMIIVAVAGGSGMFQYLALTLARPSGGIHKSLYAIFLLFVFVISLFLDTVSTILIMAPLTIQVCSALEIDFKPYLISEAIVANIGSIPSIVGAVPNIVIAEYTGLDAGTLFITFMPLAFILLTVTWILLSRFFSESLTGTTDDMRVNLLFDIDPNSMIKSRRDFYASVLAFGFLVVGFALGPAFKISPAMVALPVAAALLILAHDRAVKFLAEVGWDTIFFLVGLFGLVGALSVTGLIEEFGTLLFDIIGDNSVVAIVFMVWVPATLSAFLDNLPIAAVLAPIADQFASVSTIIPLVLVFAVNIGGMVFTPLGSPANMVAIGLSEREHDPISFVDFAKAGTLVGVPALALGTVWLLLVEFVGLGIVVIIGTIIGIIAFVVVLLPYIRPKQNT